jgi:2-enoate reductase
VIITADGMERTIEADTIVLASGAEPNNILLEELKGKVPALYLIGDCVKPRNIRSAIEDGYKTALQV